MTEYKYDIGVIYSYDDNANNVITMTENKRNIDIFHIIKIIMKTISSLYYVTYLNIFNLTK